MITAVAVLAVAIVVCGEFFTYAPKDGYGFDAEPDGNWTVTADSGKFVYSVTMMTEGLHPDRVAIYYDDEYGSKVVPALVEVGARALDTGYYISQLKNNLSYLGVKEVTTVDAAELEQLLSGGTFAYGGLVCISGALPDTVYDGTASSPILSWISNGGTLYWAEQQVGRYIGHQDGTVTEAAPGFQTLFLGSECLTDREQDDTRRSGTAFGTVDGDRIREALCLKNNNILYAVETAKVANPHLAIGFAEYGCASIVFVGNGAGQVCVFGGDYSNHQRMDMATIIASGVGLGSEVVDSATGSVKGTASGSFEIDGSSSYTVFGMIGGDFAVFGKKVDLGSSA